MRWVCKRIVVSSAFAIPLAVSAKKVLTGEEKSMCEEMKAVD